MLTPSQAATYRKLTIGDDGLMDRLFVATGSDFPTLGDRTASLVRLAALIVADADAPAYQREVRCAINAGASPEQITEVLLTVARVAGSALVMSAAPKLALALGYDVQEGFEDADARDGP